MALAFKALNVDVRESLALAPVLALRRVGAFDPAASENGRMIHGDDSIQFLDKLADALGNCDGA